MNKYDWHVESLCTKEEIINKIVEIANALCEEFTGLSVTVGNTKDRTCVDDYILPSNFQCLEIDFRYSPNPFKYTHNKYIINPREIFDLDLFEKDFRKRVVNEVIHRDDGVKVRFKGE